MSLQSLKADLADRYRVEREIGQGGMATVYLAHDIRHDRPVAIKVLHEQLAHELGADRFLAEIRTTARLRHPHILPLFDSGAHGSHLYYVMPFVDGISLRDRMTRDGALPVDDAVRIATQVAEALEYAHAHGVVHRDIKPENILIENGHALVADFGIARAAQAPGAERLTQTGMALGTPAYMSPEQSAGDRDVDARSDLYSTASVLFEMLTGEPPFRGPTVEAILVQRFTHLPPRVTAKRPAIPRHIDAAVHTAMARDPAERFASMSRFAAALVAPAAQSGAEGAKSIAVLPFASMSADPANEYFSDGIAEEIINALAHLPGLRVAARTSAFSFKGKNEDLRAIGDALNVETILEGSVRRSGDRVRITAQLINVRDGFHLWSERYDRDLTDIFAIQDEIAGMIATKLKITLSGGADTLLVRPPTANVEAYELMLKGRRLVRLRGRAIFEGMDYYERAIALDPEYAAAHAALATGLVLMAFWGLIHPDKIAGRARAAADRAMAIDASLVDSRAAAALVSLVVELDFARAQAIWDDFPPLDPGNVDVYVQRASFDRAYTRGAIDLGVRELEAAAEADPLNAYPRAQLSIVLAFGRRHREARIAAEHAFAMDPASTYTHWARIHIAVHEENVAEARQLFDDAAARFGRTPWFLMALAAVYRHKSDRSVAEAIHDELVARSRYEYVQPTAIAVAAAAAGRNDAALSEFREAARVRDPLFIAIARKWPLLDDVRALPEWEPLMREHGYAYLIERST